MNDNIRIPLAEAIGTMVLVIGGPGAAIFATGGFDGSPNVGALGVALAFGLSLMTMAYLIGRISGCHINPAVTIGMIVTKKLDAAKSAPYFIGQFVGGIVGAGIIALTLSGTDGYLSAAQDALYSILPDYTIPGIDDPATTTILAGLIGLVIVFAVMWGLGSILARRRPSA